MDGICFCIPPPQAADIFQKRKVVANFPFFFCLIHFLSTRNGCRFIPLTVVWKRRALSFSSKSPSFCPFLKMTVFIIRCLFAYLHISNEKLVDIFLYNKVICACIYLVLCRKKERKTVRHGQNAALRKLPELRFIDRYSSHQILYRRSAVRYSIYALYSFFVMVTSICDSRYHHYCRGSYTRE